MKPAALLVLQLAESQQSSETHCWVSSTSIVNSSRPTNSSWPLCSLASYPREMPPLPSSLLFAQQLSQELWEFPLLFFLQSHFSSCRVILNANIFIGQVTSDAGGERSNILLLSLLSFYGSKKGGFSLGSTFETPPPEQLLGSGIPWSPCDLWHQDPPDPQTCHRRSWLAVCCLEHDLCSSPVSRLS